MAASNYYGYTSGGQHSQGFTQVQNPPIQTSYATPQSTSGYGVQASAPAAAHYGPPQTQQPRQQVVQPAYSAASTAYQNTASGSAYGYTARQQENAPPPPPPSNTSYPGSHGGYQAHHGSAQSYYDREAYDTKASYYSQPASSNVQASQGYYAQGASATKAAYPTSGAAAYTTPASSPAVTKTHPAQAYTQSSATVAYPYSTARTQTSGYHQGSSYSSGNYGSSSSGGGGNSYHPQAYDAAVYNAATAYIQQQQQQTSSVRKPWQKGGLGSKPQKSKPPPKTPQLHYCEICKISCAGPQTYKEHLEGQKHKKKELTVKKESKETLPANAYRCELCDVTCTGGDAYAAHLKGSKHQKVLNLHQKLGKPIPEISPPKAPTPKDQKDDEKKTGSNKQSGKKQPVKKTVSPKITFVSGTKLASTIGKTDGANATAATPTTPAGTSASSQENDVSMEEEEKFDLANFTGVDKSKIVGAEYLEEVKSDDGKVVSFHCKLCECKFNDPNAKEAHLAGRRHRLSYKKKIQPDLVVEHKQSNRRLSKSQEDKLRRQWEQEQYWRRREEMWRREEEQRWHDEELRRWEEEEYFRRVEVEERFWEEERRRSFAAEYFGFDRGPMGPPPMAPLMSSPRAPPMQGHGKMQAPPRPRFDTQDDRLVMAKHSAIYPNEQELQAVQSIVSASEKALKLVSDQIAEQDSPQQAMETDQTEGAGKKEKADVTAKKEETKESETKAADAKEEPAVEEKKEPNKAEKTPAPPRALKGVMRVGVLAKGLLLKERLDVNLVVLCHDKPTKTLLKRVAENLPTQMTKVTEEKYEVRIEIDNACIKIVTTTEPKVTVTVTLTSPVMRDTPEGEKVEDDVEVLDRQKCLDALASLRHAKWFQAKANGLPSCVVIIRVMRDLCTRIPAFLPLSSWAMELLVEKSLSSSEHPLGPGEAFRRVLECISSAVFLESGPGLCDPCEKETVDSISGMSPQEREDLTAAAQHALRLQAFRQLHKVLAIDPPPPPTRFRGRFPRGGRFKRRREDSGQTDEGAKKEKKDGGDEGAEPMQTSEQPAAVEAKA